MYFYMYCSTRIHAFMIFIVSDDYLTLRHIGALDVVDEVGRE
jgi:hypothetical protein